jgi:hypothetical protein
VVVVRAGYMYQVPAILIVVQWSSRKVCATLAEQKIAYRGKGWAEKVLRKEDMQIYMLRLLLEYARLCDDNRNTLGYVRDLEG